MFTVPENQIQIRKQRTLCTGPPKTTQSKWALLWVCCKRMLVVVLAMHVSYVYRFDACVPPTECTERSSKHSCNAHPRTVHRHQGTRDCELDVYGVSHMMFCFAWYRVYACVGKHLLYNPAMIVASQMRSPDERDAQARHWE